MKKIGVIYFSNNELHRLEVGYGIAALQRSDCCLYVERIEDADFNESKCLLKEEGIEFFVIFLSYGCYDLLTKICSQIKIDNLHTKIIVCHSLVNRYYKEILSQIPQVDIAVLGEYEKTLTELSDLLINGKKFESCKGIAFKKGRKICVNSPRPLAEIDDLPFPNRDFDYQGSNFFHIYGSRGCEGYCTFCDRNSLYSYNRKHYVRWRKIENIVKEIDFLVEKYQCKFICFSDPTFLSSKDTNNRLSELYDQLLKKDYWIQFTFNIRAEEIDKAVIEKLINLKKCGLGKIFIGIESFNEDDLKLYGKRARKQEIERCIKLLNGISELTNDYYIKVEYGFINFNPYSTIDSICNNIQIFKDSKLNLNPYIIASKLTVNSLMPLSRTIELDYLLSCRIDEMSLRDVLKYAFPYNFIDKKVEKIYILIMRICNKISVQNDNGTEFLRNRYIHYYGYDSLIEKYDSIYCEWLRIVNEFSYDIFMFVLNFFNDKHVESQINIKIQMFLENYYDLERKLRGIQQRTLIELKKINEIIYYRPIFS